MGKITNRIDDGFNPEIEESVNLDATEYKHVMESKMFVSEAYNVDEVKKGPKESTSDVDPKVRRLEEKQRFDKLNQRQQELRGPDYNGGDTAGEATGDVSSTVDVTSSTASTSAASSTSASAASTGASAASSSAAVSSTATFAGGLTILAAAAVVGTSIVSGVLAGDPVIVEKPVEIGSDYLIYDFDITNLAPDVEYKIRVYNNTFKAEFSVSEGENKQIVTGLTPDLPYYVEVLSNGKLAGEEVLTNSYYTAKYYTTTDYTPKAIFEFKPFVETYDDFNKHGNNYGVDYSVYISDYKDYSSNEYLEIWLNNQLFLTNEEIDDDNFFKGKLEKVGNNIEIASKAFGIIDDVYELIGEYSYITEYDMESDVYYATYLFDENSVSSSFDLEKGQVLEINTEFDNTLDTTDLYKINVYDDLSNLLSSNIYTAESVSIIIEPIYENIKIEFVPLKENGMDYIEFESKELAYSFEPLIKDAYMGLIDNILEFSADLNFTLSDNKLLTTKATVTYLDGTSADFENESDSISLTGDNNSDFDISTVNLTVSCGDLLLYKYDYNSDDDELIINSEDIKLNEDNNVDVPYKVNIPEGATLKEASVSFPGSTDEEYDITELEGQLEITKLKSNYIIPFINISYEKDGVIINKNEWNESINLDNSWIKYFASYTFDSDVITTSTAMDAKTISLDLGFDNTSDYNDYYRIDVYDSEGQVIESTIGSDASVSIDLPVSTGDVTIKFVEVKYVDGEYIEINESDGIECSFDSIFSEMAFITSGEGINFNTSLNSNVSQQLASEWFYMTVTFDCVDGYTGETEFSYQTELNPRLELFYGEDIPTKEEIKAVNIKVLNNDVNIFEHKFDINDGIVVDDTLIDVNDDGAIVVPYTLISDSNMILDENAVYIPNGLADFQGVLDESGDIIINNPTDNNVLEIMYNAKIDGNTILINKRDIIINIDLQTDIAYFASYYTSQLHMFVKADVSFNGKSIPTEVELSYEAEDPWSSDPSNPEMITEKFYVTANTGDYQDIELGQIDLAKTFTFTDGKNEYTSSKLSEYNAILGYNGADYTEGAMFINDNNDYYIDVSVSNSSLTSIEKLIRVVDSTGVHFETIDSSLNAYKVEGYSDIESITMFLLVNIEGTNGTEKYLYEKRDYKYESGSSLVSDSDYVYIDDSIPEDISGQIYFELNENTVYKSDGVKVTYLGVDYLIPLKESTDDGVTSDGNGYSYDGSGDNYTYEVSVLREEISFNLHLTNLQESDSRTAIIAYTEKSDKLIQYISELGIGESDLTNSVNVTIGEYKSIVDLDAVYIDSYTHDDESSSKTLTVDLGDVQIKNEKDIIEVLVYSGADVITSSTFGRYDYNNHNFELIFEDPESQYQTVKVVVRKIKDTGEVQIVFEEKDLGEVTAS